jgi:hypothetical protein
MEPVIMHFGWVEHNWLKRGAPILKLILSAAGSAAALTQEDIDELFRRHNLNPRVFDPLLLQAGLNPDFIAKRSRKPFM